MSDFLVCYGWTLEFEDPDKHFLPHPDATPEGKKGPCMAIAGINSCEFSEQYAAIAAASFTDRGPLVQQFYKQNFWNGWLQGILSNEVAKRVFDFSVNSGPERAVLTFQQAVNDFHSPPLAIDGALGPLTVAATNACDPEALVKAFCNLRLEFYQSLPDWNLYGAGWKIRALA
jgi:hypothetical protein